MKNAKHTPGPWFLTLVSDYYLINSNKYVICRVRSNIETNKADAHLIAAAPKMAEILEQILSEIPEKGAITQLTRKEAFNILDQAKGES